MPENYDAKIAVLEERIKNALDGNKLRNMEVDAKFDKIDTRFTTLNEKVDDIGVALQNSRFEAQRNFNEIKSTIESAQSGLAWSWKTITVIATVFLGASSLAGFIITKIIH